MFGFYVEDPERFGVVEFDEDNNVLLWKSPANKEQLRRDGFVFLSIRVSEMAKRVFQCAVSWKSLH